MARIALDIADPALCITLKTLLESAGHEVGQERAQAQLLDLEAAARMPADAPPSLVLCHPSQRSIAIAAMRRGAFGYLLLPLEPGELELTLARALAGKAAASDAPSLKSLAEAELEHILAVLRHCKQNQAEAARILGIGRNTLWRKLRQAGGGKR